jgi:hypothetical protein
MALIQLTDRLSTALLSADLLGRTAAALRPSAPSMHVRQSVRAGHATARLSVECAGPLDHGLLSDVATVRLVRRTHLDQLSNRLPGRLRSKRPFSPTHALISLSLSLVSLC